VLKHIAGDTLALLPSPFPLSELQLLQELVSKAITTEGQVIDVFTAAGLPKPDISILSDQFLAEVRGLKHKNVAAELLEKLLKDELKVRSKRNLVQSQVFSEKLKKTLNAYHNRAISTMQVIEELIKLAKDLDAATKRGEDLGLPFSPHETERSANLFLWRILGAQSPDLLI